MQMRIEHYVRTGEECPPGLERFFDLINGVREDKFIREGSFSS